MTTSLKVSKAVLALLIVIVGAVSTFAGTVVQIAIQNPALAVATGTLVTTVCGATVVFLSTEEQTAPA